MALRLSVAALAVASVMSLGTAHVVHAQAAVEIPAESVTALLDACGGGGDACTAALEQLVASLTAAGIPLDLVLGAIAAELASASNAAIGTPNAAAIQAAASSALRSVGSAASAAGLSALAATVVAIADTVAAGGTVSAAALAQGGINAPNIGSASDT